MTQSEGRTEYDIAELKRLFHYDHETGAITRIAPNWRHREGVATCMGSNGYLRVSVNWKYISAHRLAWALHYGVFPKHTIDHINRDKTDNRIVNLRDIPHVENNKNRPGRAEHLIGTREIAGGKWRADRRINGKRHFLGEFSSQQEARAAYLSSNTGETA